MKCHADVYQASTRPYQGLPDIDYPFHDRTIVVRHCGRICLGRKKINVSQVFAGQAVGIKELQDDMFSGPDLENMARPEGLEPPTLCLEGIPNCFARTRTR